MERNWKMKIWTSERSNNVHTQRNPLEQRATLHHAPRTTLASLFFGRYACLLGFLRPLIFRRGLLVTSWRRTFGLPLSRCGAAGWKANISANFHRIFGVFKIRNAEKFDFFQISSWFSLIFMKFARIFSDFLEKRCNYSKFLDFNLILAWLYRRFI